MNEWNINFIPKWEMRIEYDECARMNGIIDPTSLYGDRGVEEREGPKCGCCTQKKNEFIFYSHLQWAMSLVSIADAYK